MNKPIIIDGVDVSECEYRTDIHKELLADGKIKIFENYCQICNDGCYAIDCYYKQLQRLKAENEKMKAFKRECLKPVCFPDVEPEVINKYKQALEDVREMCISHEKAEKIVMANEIITKINEVLKDE